MLRNSRGESPASDSLGVLVSQVSSSCESTINQKGEERSSIPTPGLNKPQQQHLHFPSIYGNTSGNFHPYSETNANSLSSSVKPQPHDAQARQISQLEIMSWTQLNESTQGINTMGVPKFQRQNSINDLKRVQGGSASHLANSSTSQQNLVPQKSSTNKVHTSAPSPSMAGVKQESFDQENVASGTKKDEGLYRSILRGWTVLLESWITSAASPAGINARTTSKKPSIGQKKPRYAWQNQDTLGLSRPLPSKKQKVSGAVSDQSIEQ